MTNNRNKVPQNGKSVAPQMNGNNGNQMSNTANARRNRNRRNRRNQNTRSVGAAIGTTLTNRGAVVSGSGDVVRVRHREFIADLTAVGTGFETRVFKINPGVATSFPWLSNLAAQFEKYRFRNLRFSYHSSVATTSAGSVMLAVDMDTMDSAPGSKALMMQMQNVVRANVWEGCQSAIPENAPELFVRTGSAPSGSDPKTYDLGQLIVANSGVAAGVYGEVWFEYDVELHIPQSTQAAILSLTATTDDGNWLDGTVTGSLVPQSVTANQLVIPLFSDKTYMCTLTSDDSADVMTANPGVAVLYDAAVSGTGTAQYIRVIGFAGSSLVTVNFNNAVTPVRKFLITPVESF